MPPKCDFLSWRVFRILNPPPPPQKNFTQLCSKYPDGIDQIWHAPYTRVGSGGRKEESAQHRYADEKDSTPFCVGWKNSQNVTSIGQWILISKAITTTLQLLSHYCQGNNYIQLIATSPPMMDTFFKLNICATSSLLPI